MKSKLKTAVAILLAAAMGTTAAFAADYQFPDTVKPGSTVGFSKSEFYDRGSGNSIPGEVDFSSDNFAISQKRITTGAALVKDIRINNRSEEVEIIFKGDAATAAPTRPNVVISELSVRAKRTIRDSGRETIVSSGDTFKFDGSISFRVGLEVEYEDMYRDGVEISLNSGESRYIKWEKGAGDGYGNAIISYGNMAYAEGRVLEGDKVYYSYDDTVDWELEDNNPDAYIQAVNMGTSNFPQAMQLQLLANKGDYIYEYNNGKLASATGLKWSEEDYAWVGKLTKGKHYVISDTRLRSVSGGTTGGSSNDYDDEDDGKSSSVPSYDNDYYNPSTGGGSNVAVAVSAIVAILAVAALSIIMSTILAVKKKQ